MDDSSGVDMLKLDRAFHQEQKAAYIKDTFHFIHTITILRDRMSCERLTDAHPVFRAESRFETL